MITDAGDLIDRLAITQFKMVRIGDSVYKRQFREYLHELFVLFLMYPEIDWWSFIQESLIYNNEVWKLESAVRQGKIDNDAEKVKQGTSEIREWNKKRIVDSAKKFTAKEVKKEFISEISKVLSSS